MRRSKLFLGAIFGALGFTAGTAALAGFEGGTIQFSVGTFAYLIDGWATNTSPEDCNDANNFGIQAAATVDSGSIDQDGASTSVECDTLKYVYLPDDVSGAWMQPLVPGVWYCGQMAYSVDDGSISVHLFEFDCVVG